jgi:outer membrane protein insertion porin family
MRRRLVAPLALGTGLACALALLAAFRGAGAAALPGWPAGALVRTARVHGAPRERPEDLARALNLPGGGVPDSAAVAQGLARLVTAFERGGYLEARVDSVGAEAARVEGAVTRADLAVWVTPGVRARFWGVRWDGLTRLDVDEANARARLVPGAPFDPLAVSQGLARVVTAYEDRGFPAARASVVDLERHGDSLAVVVRVFEGDSTIVREVAFPGAVLTRAFVLQKSVGNVVGLPYNRARLAAARQRLLDLGIFTRVDEPVAALVGPGAARVRWPVEEAQANAFDGAVGYEGQTKSLTGLFDVHLLNLGGRARQAGLHWEGRGKGRSQFEVRYAEPLLFGLDLKGELQLTQLLEDTLYTRTSWQARFTFGAWGGGRFWVGGARDRTVLPDGPTQRASTTTTEAGFELDRRDDRLAPRRGAWARVSSGTVFKRETLRPEGSDKATQLVAHALGQWNRAVGRAAGFRLESEGALRLSNEPAIPLYDQDLVGGATTLRGYREGQFRASRWVVTRVEYGVFTVDRGRAFAFVDDGVLYRPFLDSLGVARHETLNRPGYGVGFEAPMTLGRLALTLAYGKGDGPLDGKIHVRLSSRF